MMQETTTQMMKTVVRVAALEMTKVVQALTQSLVLIPQFLMLSVLLPHQLMMVLV
jgi:hypothetical protein